MERSLFPILVVYGDRGAARGMVEGKEQQVAQLLLGRLGGWLRLERAITFDTIFYRRILRYGIK